MSSKSEMFTIAVQATKCGTITEHAHKVDGYFLSSVITFYQFHIFSSQVIHYVCHFHFRGPRNIWLLQSESKKLKTKYSEIISQQLHVLHVSCVL